MDFIHFYRQDTVAVDTAEGRGKNEPLGALTTKWHAKGAAFQPRMEYKIRTCYVKRINLMPYPGQGWNDASSEQIVARFSFESKKKNSSCRTIIIFIRFLYRNYSNSFLKKKKKKLKIFVIAQNQ